MNTLSQRFHDKIYAIKQKIPLYGGDNLLNIHQKSKYAKDVMLSKSDKARWNVQVFNNSNWKIGLLNNLFEMNFEGLDASTGELRVSENLTAFSKHAGWVRLMPYLTLKNHVSKHTQLH